jgi:predicted  nucleic acid-binding Zn-ribbon protein
MATAAQRMERMEDRVKYLEEREKLVTVEVNHLRELNQRATADGERQRDEFAKLRDDFTRFRETIATDVAVLKSENAELKKHREHWSQRA